jgi:hypothetical protein
MTPQPPNPELAALPDLFLLDIQNRNLVDGKAPRAGYNGTLLFVAILLPVLSLLAVLWNGGPWLTYLQLKLSGQPVTALVTEQMTEQQCVLTSCADHYFLSYRFLAVGDTYTGRTEVDVMTFFSVFRGLPIGVIYLPDNPAVSRVQGSEIEPTLIPRGILTVGLLIGAVAALAAGILHVRTARSPRSRGRLLQGEVLDWQTQDMNSGTKDRYFQVALRYAFRNPQGQRVEHTHTMKMAPGKYQSSYFPKAGAPLAVLYVDDNGYEVL